MLGVISITGNSYISRRHSLCSGCGCNPLEKNAWSFPQRGCNILTLYLKMPSFWFMHWCSLVSIFARQSSFATCEDCGGSGICSECKGEGFVLKKLSDENADKARLTAKNMATRYTAGWGSFPFLGNLLQELVLTFLFYPCDQGFQESGLTVTSAPHPGPAQPVKEVGRWDDHTSSWRLYAFPFTFSLFDGRRRGMIMIKSSFFSNFRDFHGVIMFMKTHSGDVSCGCPFFSHFRKLLKVVVLN